MGDAPRIAKNPRFTRVIKHRKCSTVTCFPRTRTRCAYGYSSKCYDPELAGPPNISALTSQSHARRLVVTQGMVSRVRIISGRMSNTNNAGWKHLAAKTKSRNPTNGDVRRQFILRFVRMWGFRYECHACFDDGHATPWVRMAAEQCAILNLTYGHDSPSSANHRPQIQRISLGHFAWPPAGYVARFPPAELRNSVTPSVFWCVKSMRIRPIASRNMIAPEAKTPR